MKPRILIVDDDVDLLELLRGALENAGYFVRTETTGEAALELAGTFHPELILLDVMLPQTNGFSVCEQLRSLPASANTPIMLMTALSGDFPRLEGIESGCNAYLSKPFQMRDLLLRVEELLSRQTNPPGLPVEAQKVTAPQSPRLQV